MSYGFVVWLGLILLTIFGKTYAYVDEEAKKGVGRLMGVILGTVVVVVLVIFGFKIMVSSL